MAVYYKFKSAKDYHSIPIIGQFISVASLKETILKSNCYGKGKDFDLMISNAQTDEEYIEEATMIPRNTSVLIRRLPWIPHKPIITGKNKTKVAEDKPIEIPPSSSTSMAVGDCFTMPKESESDIFVSDPFCIQEAPPAQSSSLKVDNFPASKDDEDSKIKALINTPALDWNSQGNYYGFARRFPRRSGSMIASFGFGHCGLGKRTPPAGYVCRRCNLTGHFIKNCPTNGDPNYDIKKLKRPTGIPKSMLVETPDGAYALPGGTTVAMKPNESAFEKEVERLSFTSCANDIPPDLWCPLCKEVMKDCVISSKCCFKSYCDKCIRTYIIAKSKCFCGATNILADYLIPNITIREAISRILVSGTSSAENSGRVKVRDASKDGPEQSLLVDCSGDVKEPESATHSLLTMKQPEKCTTDLIQELHKSMSAEEAVSVKEVSRVEKKRRRKKREIEEIKGMSMGLSGYNEYNWSDFLPIANEGYMSSFSVMNPYVGQCYYYNQSNWDITELWMNGVSIKQGLPPFVGKVDVKRNPDIEQNELYHKNRDKSCQRNRGAASANGNVNDSLLKSKSGMISQIDRADQADDKCIKETDKDSHVGPSHGAFCPSPSQRIEKNGCNKVLCRPYQSSFALYDESSDEERHFKRKRSWSRGSDRLLLASALC